jgi:hypothetical protein
MRLDFDLDRVRHIEFGVGVDSDEGQSFRSMMVDDDTQAALREMAEATWDVIQESKLEPRPYEPSEKYASLDYVCLSIDSDLAKQLRDLHRATNLPMDMSALSDPPKVFCYFARMVDEQGRSLTGLRRATHFKGVLRSRLIRFSTDALKYVEGQVFKLDHDFDLLVDSSVVHVLRPSGFEAAGKLQEAVLSAVPRNVQEIQNNLLFMDLANVEEYSSKRPRAARYIASIKTENLAEGIDRGFLEVLCNDTGVGLFESDGKIMVEDGHIMGFLEVLDRRRYGLELIPGSPESFRAVGRSKLNN